MDKTHQDKDAHQSITIRSTSHRHQGIDFSSCQVVFEILLSSCITFAVTRKPLDPQSTFSSTSCHAQCQHASLRLMRSLTSSVKRVIVSHSACRLCLLLQAHSSGVVSFKKVKACSLVLFDMLVWAQGCPHVMPDVCHIWGLQVSRGFCLICQCLRDRVSWFSLQDMTSSHSVLAALPAAAPVLHQGATIEANSLPSESLP